MYNRGFGGYTSNQAVEILPELTQSLDLKKTALAVVWFGTNDAVNPKGPQCVVLEGRREIATLAVLPRLACCETVLHSSRKLVVWHWIRVGHLYLARTPKQATSHCAMCAPPCLQELHAGVRR